MQDTHAGITPAVARRAGSFFPSWTASAVVWLLLVLALTLPPSAAAAMQQAEGSDKAPAADATDPNDDPPAEPAAKPAQAAEMPQPEGTVLGTVQLQGAFQIGIRAVSVDGATNRYKEDYDLDDGLRLVNTRLVIRPTQPSQARMFDRVTVQGHGLGGDPYESFGVTAYKSGAYNFTARSRTVDYFYEPMGDPHAWDVTRNHSDVRLTVNATDDVQLSARFNRFRQDRSRTTTRDEIRDEFHFHEPLDQDGTTLGFGVRWHIDTTDLFFNQDFVHFNDNSGFTSGPNAGGPTATFIEALSHSEVRAMDAPITRGGFHSLLVDNRVEINGDYLYSRQTMGFDFVRLWEGLDRFSEPVEVTASNSGGATRFIRHANLSARVKAHDQVYVTGRYRHRDWDQSGSAIGEDILLFTASGTFSLDEGSALSSYRVKADQFMFGAEVFPTDLVSVFGEVGFTQKDKQFDKQAFDDFPRGSDETTDLTTDTTAFRIGGIVRPDPRVNVRVTFDRGDIDDPLTQISPTETNNFKLRVRIQPAERWAVQGSATYRTIDNTLAEAESTNKSFGVSVSRMLERGHATLGFTRLDWASMVPFVFILDDRTTGNSVSEYAAESNVFTAAAEYGVVEDLPLSVYGSLAIVDNGGTLPLQRLDTKIGGRYTFADEYFVDLQVRFIDFEQDLFDVQGTILDEGEPSSVNNYDATVFTLGVGFKF